MYGKIIKARSDRRLRFIADSGTGIPIIPIEIAEEHGLEIRDTDPDEPGCIGATGHDLEIVGQTEMYVKMETMKKVKRVHPLIARQAHDKILLDLNTLIEWSILPKNFPQPMNEKDRETKKKVKKVSVVDTKMKLIDVKEKKESQRTRIVFNEQDEGNFDNNQKMGQLRDTFLKEF